MIKIGQRIKELREEWGISQRKLAELMRVSRPTISQIENGARKICAEDLKRIAEIFNTSVDNLLELRKEPEVIIKEGQSQQNRGVGVHKIKSPIRINVPQKNLKKFKDILLYILNKVGSKPNIGETVLYKLLYFIDFDFYEKYEEQLIGATYMKNRYGPTPLEFKKIVKRMIKGKEIEKVESPYFEYPQTKYLPLKRPNLSELKANEIEVVDDVLNKLSDMNANQISEYSHNDVPWLTTEAGKIIEYESVFYRTASYSVRE